MPSHTKQVMEAAVDDLQFEARSNPFTATKPKSCHPPGRGAILRERLGKVKYRAISLSRSFRIVLVDISVIAGKEKSSGETIKTLYIGEAERPQRSIGKLYSNSEALEKHDNFLFLMDCIYSDYRIVAQTKNVGSLYLNRWIKHYENQVDLVYIDVELFYSAFIDKSAYISLPQWLPQKKDIPDTWDELLQGFGTTFRRDLRRCLKRNFKYMISRTEECLRLYYHDLYVPYVRKRFGPVSFISPYESVAHDLHDGGYLLFLVLDNQIVAGVLLKHKEDQVLAISCASADETLRSSGTKGAIDALLYYALLNAFERGCCQFDFLGSRPFLENGPFQFKRKWGTFIDNFYEPINEIYFKAFNLGPAVRSYIANNPFVSKKNGRFIAKILLTHRAAKEDLDRCVKRYNTQGLHGMDIYCLEGVDAEIGEYLMGCRPNLRVLDLKDSEFPERDFCLSRPFAGPI